MKCPQCGNKAEQLHDTALGSMCQNCVFTAASAGMGEFKVKPVNNQMQMFNFLAPHFNEQFLNETTGAVRVDYSENGWQKAPERTMWVGYFDRKKKTNIMHAAFSCS